jgi:hypothetical protein
MKLQNQLEKLADFSSLYNHRERLCNSYRANRQHTIVGEAKLC